MNSESFRDSKKEQETEPDKFCDGSQRLPNELSKGSEKDLKLYKEF